MPRKTSKIKKNDEKREALYVHYHDDSPCSGSDSVRLINGVYCPRCEIYPDTQSKCLKLHCPDCDIPLEKMFCIRCGMTFQEPLVGDSDHEKDDRIL